MANFWNQVCTVPWMELSFPVMIAFAFLVLWRMDGNAETGFKFHQFLTTKDGLADKYSLGYILVLFVGTWGVWFLATKDRLTEWFWTAYIGAFVLGAAWKTGSNLMAQIKGAASDTSSTTTQVIRTSQTQTAQRQEPDDLPGTDTKP